MPKESKERCLVCKKGPVVATDSFGMHSCDACITFEKQMGEHVDIWGKSVSFDDPERFLVRVDRKRSAKKVSDFKDLELVSEKRIIENRVFNGAPIFVDTYFDSRGNISYQVDPQNGIYRVVTAKDDWNAPDFKDDWKDLVK